MQNINNYITEKLNLGKAKIEQQYVFSLQSDESRHWDKQELIDNLKDISGMYDCDNLMIVLNEQKNKYYFAFHYVGTSYATRHLNIEISSYGSNKTEFLNVRLEDHPDIFVISHGVSTLIEALSAQKRTKLNFGAERYGTMYKKFINIKYDNKEKCIVLEMNNRKAAK